MGTGAVRSELGVGRLIFPLSYKVNDRLSVGATLDYSWAGLDMKMAASANGGGQVGPTPSTHPAYFQLESMFASANGMDITATTQQGTVQSQILGQFTGMAQGFNSNFATSGVMAGSRLDFSNSSDFTGAAKSTGFTGKLGLVFKASDALNVGLSYQPATNLKDMKTSASGARFTLMDTAGEIANIDGQIIVKNFQMPSVTALGLSFDATPQLKLALDVKSIGWKSVMEKFNMAFVVAANGAVMNFAMDQHWKDQTVVSLGAAYSVNEDLLLRAGYSHSSNPVPNDYVHPLFPATIKDHYTFGFGYKLGKNSTMSAAVSHAPKVSAVNTASAMPITHSQTNYQLMLSYRY